MFKASGVLLFNDHTFISDVSKFKYYCSDDDREQNLKHDILVQQHTHQKFDRQCFEYSMFDSILDPYNKPKLKPCYNPVIGYICCSSEPLIYYCQAHKNLILTMLRCECGSDAIHGYVNNNKLFGVCVTHWTMAKYKKTFIRADYTMCDIDDNK